MRAIGIKSDIGWSYARGIEGFWKLTEVGDVHHIR
jgi:hypothetical protein